ncbi:MAG: hypothetical protein ACREAY_05180 [Nitrososphaera sp.]|uniref:hypothetical protein n=1 Tax=Nitrososphaera sp. TaxID=1971748 RepID=UPI003D6E00BB
MNKSRILLLAALSGALLVTTLSAFAYFGNNAKSKLEPVQESEAVHFPAHMIDIYTKSEKYYDNLDGGYLYVHDNIVDSRRHCEFCTSVDYQQGFSTGTLDLSWAADKQFNLNGAKKVTFYVMGDEGGEKVKFKAAGKKIDKIINGTLAKDVEFGIESQPVVLTDEWKKFEIDLTKTDLNGVSNPFAVGIDRDYNDGPVRIFIKAILLENDPVQNALPVEQDGGTNDEDKQNQEDDD